MSTPFLSVCIPTYNRVGYLKKCLKSVLSQVSDEVEVIVQDNCSTDGTEAWMRTVSDPHLRYFRNPENVGLVNNVIQIISNARGQYVYMLTDDDYLLINGLEDTIRFAKETNCLAFKTAYFLHNEVSKTGAHVSLFPRHMLPADMNEKNAAVVYHGSNILTGIVFKKEIFEEKRMRENSHNWYPSLLLMGMAGLNVGYLSDPTNVHIWENETHWGISPEKRDELNRGQVETLLYLLKENKISKEYYVALAKGHISKFTFEKNERLNEPLSDSQRKELAKHFSSIKRRDTIRKFKVALKRLVP